MLVNVLKKLHNEEGEDDNKSTRENHAFRRVMIIHISTKFRLFDFVFPNAWQGTQDSGITGFVLSCLQFHNEFGGDNGKFILQPQHNPVSDILNGRSSGSISNASSGGDISPKRRAHERNSSLTYENHRKSMKHSSSMGSGLGNLGVLAQQKLRQQLAIADNDAETPSDSLLFGNNNASLLYFVLATDQIFSKSKLVCALFLDGDDDWLQDGRELSKRLVNQMATMHKEAIEKLKKNSEETEDEEEQEQLKLYEGFITQMHTVKLEVLSERVKRKSEQGMNSINESKHA
jgi:hypothetical protein